VVGSSQCWLLARPSSMESSWGMWDKLMI
jgi:hypothetical protein